MSAEGLEGAEADGSSAFEGAALQARVARAMEMKVSQALRVRWHKPCLAVSCTLNQNG